VSQTLCGFSALASLGWPIGVRGFSLARQRKMLAAALGKFKEHLSAADLMVYRTTPSL